jgi:hypothetical protein
MDPLGRRLSSRARWIVALASMAAVGLFLTVIFLSSRPDYAMAPAPTESSRPTSGSVAEEPVTTSAPETAETRPPTPSVEPGVPSYTTRPVPPSSSAVQAPSSPPVTSAPPSSTGVPSAPALSTFVRECIHRPGGTPGDLSSWRMGQVNYPMTIELEVSKSAVYVAAVDVRDQPAPAAEVIPASSAVGTRIAVRCVLNARLSGDEVLTVDPDDWTTRQFNPVGILNWSWRVTADDTGDHDLVLALQPAVIAEDTGEVIAIGDKSRETSTFTTRVRVNGSVPQQLGSWWKQNWPAISLVGGGAGGVILASILWGRKSLVGIRDLLKAWRGFKAPELDPPVVSEKDEGDNKKRKGRKGKIIKKN